MPDYPHIDQGVNKFTADVFNRVMADLKEGESSWETLKGMIRDRSGFGGTAGGPSARLCIIGGSFELDSRDVDAIPPAEYYGQWIYEWAEVSMMGFLPRKAPNCSGSIEDAKYPAGIEFNTIPVTTPLGYTGYGINRDTAKWHLPISIDPEGDQKRYPSPADPNQPARFYTGGDPDPILDRRIWRFSEHAGEDCCNDVDADCTSPAFSSGGAMNIAEASTSLYGEGTAGEFLFPGTKLDAGCLSTSLKDLVVSPIKRGSLVWMHLVPFYPTMSASGIPRFSRPRWINMFSEANAIDACCQPPEGEGAAAGSVSFRSVGTAEITTSANFHYDETTNTLHVRIRVFLRMQNFRTSVRYIQAEATPRQSPRQRKHCSSHSCFMPQ